MMASCTWYGARGGIVVYSTAMSVWRVGDGLSFQQDTCTGDARKKSIIKPLAAHNSASQLESATEAWVWQMFVSNDPLRKIAPELVGLRVVLQPAHEESLNASKMYLPSAVQSGILTSPWVESSSFQKSLAIPPSSVERRRMPSSGVPSSYETKCLNVESACSPHAGTGHVG